MQGLDDDADKVERWQNHFISELEKDFAVRHGSYNSWLQQISQLPGPSDNSHFPLQINQGRVCVQNQPLPSDNSEDLEQQLLKFSPWRKGPFEVNSVFINSEWHSDFKWERLTPFISDLKGRMILDVGCGNGYHSFRMQEQGAKLVLGIDPCWLFLAQFQVIKHFIPDINVFHLPIGIEQMPENMRAFDTAFSMGVLYHRRSPLDHLFQLKQLLKDGGELVLETLIIDGKEGECLVPEGRYAKMRNVWFIPTIASLELWLKRCGFKNIRAVSVEKTSLEEQRRTSWMQHESLADFLDPNDSEKTIESYPAPERVIMIANK